MQKWELTILEISKQARLKKRIFLLTTAWICDNIIVEILRQALNLIITPL